MNRREMKKRIALHAFEALLTEVTASDNPWYDLATYILDRNEDELTEAEQRRYVSLLREMVQNAYDKLN